MQKEKSVLNIVSACRTDKQTVEKLPLQLCPMCIISFPFMHTKYSLTTTLAEKKIKKQMLKSSWLSFLLI